MTIKARSQRMTGARHHDQRLRLEDALACALVIAGEGTAPRHHTDAFFESQGLALPAGCVETQSSLVERLVVAGSDTIWIVPQRVAQDDLAAGLLTVIDVPAPRGVEQIGILRRSAEPDSEAITAFAEQIRRAVMP